MSYTFVYVLSVVPLTGTAIGQKQGALWVEFAYSNRWRLVATFDRAMVRLEIEGLDEVAALIVVSEIGTDMTRFAKVLHFCSCWLGLCPQHKKTGGKIKSSRTRPGMNRAAAAMRMGASNLVRSKTAMGAFHFTGRDEGKVGRSQGGGGNGAQNSEAGVQQLAVWQEICEAVAGRVRKKDARETDSEREKGRAGVGDGRGRGAAAE